MQWELVLLSPRLRAKDLTKKVYSALKREAYSAIADRAKKDGIPFAGHVPDSVSDMEASNAGQKSIEHLLGVPLACSRSDLRGVSEDGATISTGRDLFFPQQIPRPALLTTRTCLRLAKTHRATCNFAQLFGQF